MRQLVGFALVLAAIVFTIVALSDDTAGRYYGLGLAAVAALAGGRLLVTRGVS